MNCNAVNGIRKHSPAPLNYSATIRPNLLWLLHRSDQDENYQKVRRVVLQSCSAEGEGVRQVRLQAGTLMLFCGRNSLHRVTRVEGGRQRVLAVLSYEDRPGVLLNEYTRKKFYGRLN